MPPTYAHIAVRTGGKPRDKPRERHSDLEVSKLPQGSPVLGACRRGDAHDEVIEHLDFQELPTPDEIPGNPNVRFAGRRIPARMIVGEDDGMSAV